MADPNISHLIQANAVAIRMIQQAVAEAQAMQVESEDNLSQYLDTSSFAPLQRIKNFKDLNELVTQILSSEEQEVEEAKEVHIMKMEIVEQVADRFQKNNFELNRKTLLILRQHLNAQDSPEDIVRKVLAVYPDPSLADEALEFLLETASPDLSDAMQKAKEKLNADFSREIRAGRNMGAQARQFSEAGLGSPNSLRDLYRDITGTQREPLALFNELSEKFNYDNLKSAIQFMLHSLGVDLRAKGPSIARGDLKRLIDEIRSLQGILGVFRFFQSRVRLMDRQFQSYNLPPAHRPSFEHLARLFIKILGERYMNGDKILQTAKLLEIEKEIAAQIIVYTQMKDAIRQVAPRYFRDMRHKEEQLNAYLEALEKLDDQMEDEEEEKDKKEDEEEKNS